jgi:aryl-alcohol dehydrogenase-like predicted oxidoreductase
MNFRKLGNTGIEVSEIGFGAWAVGGNRFGNSYGPTDDAVSISAIREALELGCTFFDTADVYGHGHSEHLLGAALGAHRRQVVIATKVGGDFYGPRPTLNFSPDYIRTALERSLARLATDYIDLYQLHNPPHGAIRDGRVFELLESLKSEGKIRAAGISIFGPEEGIVAISHFGVDAVQVVYNMFDPAADGRLFPLALRNGTGIVAREPLANGFLTGKYGAGSTFPEGDIRASWPREYIEARAAAALRLAELAAAAGVTPAQLALRYALSQEAVSVVIPGIKSPEQARENLAASTMGPPDMETLRGITLLQRRDFGL